MTKPELISVDDVFKPPVMGAAAISPDGSRVAYLAPWRDRMNIWVASLDAGTEFGADARRVTADATRSIMNFPPIHETTPGPNAFDVEALARGELRFIANEDPEDTTPATIVAG